MASPCVSLSSLGLTARGGANPDITGVAVDSRAVKEGFLFAAMPGSRVHGAEFIQYALRMGAVAVLTDAEGAEIAADLMADAGTAVVITDAPREALSRAAALWSGAQPQTMVAVTGTNGKTSVSTFVRQIWIEMDLPAVNLGTTGVEGAWAAPRWPIPRRSRSPCIARWLRRRKTGSPTPRWRPRHMGWINGGLDGVTLRAAGFTNFTQDHLDYHETFEAYFDAKAGTVFAGSARRMARR